MREPLYGWTQNVEYCADCGAILHTTGNVCPDCQADYEANFEDWKDIGRDFDDYE